MSVGVEEEGGVRHGHRLLRAHHPLAGHTLPGAFSVEIRGGPARAPSFGFNGGRAAGTGLR